MSASVHFVSLDAAATALRRIRQPLLLARFAPDPADWVIVAVNQAATAIDAFPKVGDHPDRRRDRELTPDLELEYLYQRLVERGHAQQVLALDGGHLYEIAVSRAIIEDDEAVYGFVTITLRADHMA